MKDHIVGRVHQGHQVVTLAGFALAAHIAKNPGCPEAPMADSSSRSITSAPSRANSGKWSGSEVPGLRLLAPHEIVDGIPAMAKADYACESDH